MRFSKVNYTASIPVLADFESPDGPPLCLDESTGRLYYVTPSQVVTEITGGISSLPIVSGPRLTLTSGTPVTNADVTGATAIYYEPFNGDRTLVYNGSVWTPTSVGSRLTLNLDNNSGHTGYHQSGKNFDLWVVSDSGTLRLGTGAAWASDTTLTDARVVVNGLWMNNASMTLRYGSGAGDTLTVAAQRALLVGSVRMTANGQCEDSSGTTPGNVAKRFLSNVFNEQPRLMARLEATDSWSYATAAIQQARASSDNEVRYLNCLASRPSECRIDTYFTVDNVGGSGNVMVGLDGTTKASGSLSTTADIAVAGDRVNVSAAWVGFAGLGYHRNTWLERGGGVGTQTWYGDQAAPTIVQTGMLGWMLG